MLRFGVERVQPLAEGAGDVALRVVVVHLGLEAIARQPREEIAPGKGGVVGARRVLAIERLRVDPRRAVLQGEALARREAALAVAGAGFGQRAARVRGAARN